MVTQPITGVAQWVPISLIRCIVGVSQLWRLSTIGPISSRSICVIHLAG